MELRRLQPFLRGGHGHQLPGVQVASAVNVNATNEPASIVFYSAPPGIRCTTLTSNATPPSVGMLTVGNGGILAAGGLPGQTFPFGALQTDGGGAPGSVAVASLVFQPPDAAAADFLGATGGSVTFQAGDPSVLNGTFTATFPQASGEAPLQATGTFSAPSCAGK